MIEAAEFRPGDTVLEVGAGSGYAAAVIGQIAAQVDRRSSGTASSPRSRASGWSGLATANVEIVEGDGTSGCRPARRFDAILVAASGSHVPEALTAQLAPGGRLVMPLGAPDDVAASGQGHEERGRFARAAKALARCASCR